MNDYAGLATALLAARGIGELPLVVQPDLGRDSRLVEIMPDWRFRTYDTLCVLLLRASGSLA
jgi:DNA-binding transcriptional LysR family regulator